MYMQGFKCKVTNATSAAPISAAQAPVFCREDATKCVKGAKQMIVYNRTYILILQRGCRTDSGNFEI